MMSVDPMARLIGDVRLGAGAQVGACAVLEGPLWVGEDLRAHPGALIGGPAQHRNGGGDGSLRLGDRVEIREAATLHRGTASGKGTTHVGSDVLVMAYAHVGHDCSIGDEVTLCNGAQVGGHVDIGSAAMVGARAAIHQFVRVGKGAMVAAGALVTGDVPPWTMVAGDRARIIGPNTHAFRQHFNEDSLLLLRRAIRLLWPGLKRTAIRPEDLHDALGLDRLMAVEFIDDLVRFLQGPAHRPCCPRGRR
jgi:UDP-N-acetylglucosamine acyltransferase